eukprot:m51a1_g4950 hypothetical protein (312) ;mRNA; f:335642-336726
MPRALSGLNKKQRLEAAPADHGGSLPQVLFALLLDHAVSWAAARALSSTCRSARSAYTSSPWHRLVPAAAALHSCCVVGEETNGCAEEVSQIGRILAMATEATVRLKFLRAARYWASRESSSEALLRSVPRMRVAVSNGWMWLQDPMLRFSCSLMIPGPSDDGRPHIFESIILTGHVTESWGFNYAPAGSVAAAEWVSDAEEHARAVMGDNWTCFNEPQPPGVCRWQVDADAGDAVESTRRAAREELCPLVAELAGSIGCAPTELVAFVFHMIEGTDNEVLDYCLFSESEDPDPWRLNSYLVEQNLSCHLH